VTEARIPRPTARILVIDEDDRVLLILAADGEYRGSGQAVWLTPGGGLDEGETYEQAAQRELREEVGLNAAELDSCVWVRRLPFTLSDGVPREKHERYFVSRAAHFEPAGDAAQLDLEAVAGFRWWTADEVEASTELFAPRRLGSLLRTLLQDGPPAEPVDVGL
jgi:ADP-ribose pyrophosphatase YjhB (NUDIX family)